MDILDTYLEAQKEIFKYFGYTDGWRKDPVIDSREYFWRIADEKVLFSKTIEGLDGPQDDYDEEDDEFRHEIYLEEFRRGQLVLQGESYLLLQLTNENNGNLALHIFSNDKETKKRLELKW